MLRIYGTIKSRTALKRCLQRDAYGRISAMRAR